MPQGLFRLPRQEDCPASADPRCRSSSPITDSVPQAADLPLRRLDKLCFWRFNFWAAGWPTSKNVANAMAEILFFQQLLRDRSPIACDGRLDDAPHVLLKQV